MAARTGSAYSVTQLGTGVVVGVGRNVRVGVAVGTRVAVDVLVGVKVVVGVGATRLEMPGMLFLPSHKTLPMTARINIPARMPMGRLRFLVFDISC